VCTAPVRTFVVNHTMPAPFEAPLPLVVVDLDDGARVLLQGMPEDAAALGIGDKVVLELRRYAVERGAPVYGYKVRRAVVANGSTNGAAPTAEPATAGARRGDS
jgi:hydroxymethylglutaryl-CoA synthase